MPLSFAMLQLNTQIGTCVLPILVMQINAAEPLQFILQQPAYALVIILTDLS